MNREAWLQAAVEKLESLFPSEYIVPEVHVSPGWPSTGGLATKKVRLGECWKPETSADGNSHIFLNPMYDNPVEILSTLLHELIHAVDRGESGHKGLFVKIAREVGFTKPWTSTPETDDLRLNLEQIASELPEYPHSKITHIPKVKKQGTRMLKAECPTDGYTVRLTKKWIDFGLPICPCGATMKTTDLIVEDKGEKLD